MAWWRMTLFVLTQECSLLILFLILILLVRIEFLIFCVLLFLVLLMVLAAHSSQSWNILVTVIYHINKLFIEKDNSSFLFSWIYPDNETNTETEYIHTYTHRRRKKVYDQFLYQVWFETKKRKVGKRTFFLTFCFITLLYVGCTSKSIHYKGNSVRDEMRYLWDKFHIYYAIME